MSRTRLTSASDYSKSAEWRSIIHTAQGSRRMRELRVQRQGRPYRVLYAFDPRRTAILLIGGDKTGQDRWYDEHVPRADDLYDTHLASLKAEGLLPHDET